MPPERRKPSHAEMDVRPLDKMGFVPLYFQIQQELIKSIAQGRLKEGTMLPSEDELSRKYDVSRMTARQALQGLKLNGHAYSERGRGTFVSRPKLEKNILHLQGFTEEIEQQGRTPHSRILERTILPATPELQIKLQLGPEEEILSLTRLRIADEEPVALDISHLPLSRMPRLRDIDFTTNSIYRSIREQHGIRLAWADEIIEAIAASSEEAELLGVPCHSPILSIQRVVFSAEKLPVEVAWTRYPGSRYRASIHLPFTA
ncbi:GntR family transcriptional regulator [Edaphobacter bradus]|uniref:GntR family transcriptional regulator n=1 Tax=Edaphobacter bradus TaxID=2259016 RepID=UPI0021E0BF87|nr:GntR family transcriptional regulator [Edaphobacter bradus]